MNPYGEFGRPLRLLEAYKEWRDTVQLEEADSKADFASFLYGPIRTSIYNGYQRAQSQWRRYARVENAPDFRERRIKGLNALKGMSYVGDHGNYGVMTRTDRPPASLSVDTYGGIYAITRQAIRNDDTNELLNRVPTDMGYAAGLFITETVIAHIEGNPTSPDGHALFDNTNHGNEGTAALSEDSLVDAVSAMEAQLDDDGFHITVSPRTLAVKTARLQLIANRIINSQETGAVVNYTGGSAGVGSAYFDKGRLNPVAGIMPADAVVRDPFLSDTNDWYLFADPQDVPAFAVGFLDGREEPFVGLKDPMVRAALGAGVDPYSYDLDSIDFKVRIDYGVAPIDPRGVRRNVVS